MRSRTCACASVLMAMLSHPTAVHAQFGTFEKLFDKLTDVNFYIGGDISRASQRSYDLNVSQFGVELMYNIGAYSSRKSDAPRGDTIRWTWSETEISRGSSGTDTVYTYTMAPRPAPRDTSWTFELGLGYGQISGVHLVTEGYTVTGTVREFPSASMYATHVPTALYGGIRSGLIQSSGLHAYSASGATHRASASAFQFGGVVGYAPGKSPFFPFLELGWIFREFGAVDWSGENVPAVLPRQLDVSGWQLIAGVQLSLKK